jgi:hypothetical protein
MSITVKMLRIDCLWGPFRPITLTFHLQPVRLPVHNAKDRGRSRSTNRFHDGDRPRAACGQYRSVSYADSPKLAWQLTRSPCEGIPYDSTLAHA